jgi:hypothetical protein
MNLSDECECLVRQLYANIVDSRQELESGLRPHFWIWHSKSFLPQTDANPYVSVPSFKRSGALPLRATGQSYRAFALFVCVHFFEASVMEHFMTFCTKHPTSRATTFLTDCSCPCAVARTIFLTIVLERQNFTHSTSVAVELWQCDSQCPGTVGHFLQTPLGNWHAPGLHAHSNVPGFLWYGALGRAFWQVRAPLSTLGLPMHIMDLHSHWPFGPRRYFRAKLSCVMCTQRKPDFRGSLQTFLSAEQPQRPSVCLVGPYGFADIRSRHTVWSPLGLRH